MVWNKASAGVSPVTIPTVIPGNTNRPPRVAICVPYQTSITMQWAYKMMIPLWTQPTDFCEKVHKMVRGIPLPVARDQLVDTALEDKTVTHLLWVDTDNIPQSPENPNDALKALMNCNVPIVSGLYKAKQAEGFNNAMWYDLKMPNQSGFSPINQWTGNFIEADVIGFGFCLIKREVFEKIPRPWFPWNTVSPSEDFNFCIKARQHGYKINVFTDIKLMHEGNLMVDTDGKVSVLKI